MVPTSASRRPPGAEVEQVKLERAVPVLALLRKVPSLINVSVVFGSVSSSQVLAKASTAPGRLTIVAPPRICQLPPVHCVLLSSTKVRPLSTRVPDVISRPPVMIVRSPGPVPCCVPAFHTTGPANVSVPTPSSVPPCCVNAPASVTASTTETVPLSNRTGPTPAEVVPARSCDWAVVDCQSIEAPSAASQCPALVNDPRMSMVPTSASRRPPGAGRTGQTRAGQRRYWRSCATSPR